MGVRRFSEAAASCDFGRRGNLAGILGNSTKEARSIPRG